MLYVKESCDYIQAHLPLLFVCISGSNYVTSRVLNSVLQLIYNEVNQHDIQIKHQNLSI
jgi:hypothetical protein